MDKVLLDHVKPSSSEEKSINNFDKWIGGLPISSHMTESAYSNHECITDDLVTNENQCVSRQSFTSRSMAGNCIEPSDKAYNNIVVKLESEEVNIKESGGEEDTGSIDMATKNNARLNFEINNDFCEIKSESAKNAIKYEMLSDDNIEENYPIKNESGKNAIKYEMLSDDNNEEDYPIDVKVEDWNPEYDGLDAEKNSSIDGFKCENTESINSEMLNIDPSFFLEVNIEPIVLGDGVFSHEVGSLKKIKKKKKIKKSSKSKLGLEEKHNLVTDPSKKIYVCVSCKKIFDHREKLNSHRLQIHNEGRPNICKVCSKSFTQSSGLSRHMKLHTQPKIHKCQVCPKTFRRRDDLIRHMVVHTGEKFSCRICFETFNQKALLAGHMLNHEGEKPYLCDFCYMGFEYKSFLVKHLVKHTGQRDFVCKICLKTFTQISSLNTHMLIHSGKPHKCKICDKSFTKRCDVRIHMSVHTGVKPYSCDICLKGFTHRGHLAQHKLIHTGLRDFKCELCSQTFTLKGNLAKHMVVHSTEKNFPCPICLKKFTRSCTLRKHLLTQKCKIGAHK